MNDSTRVLLSVALVPVVFLLLQYFVCRPLEKQVNKYLPPRVARILTRKYFEDPPCPP